MKSQSPALKNPALLSIICGFSLGGGGEAGGFIH